MTTAAKVIADSLSPAGVRLTTMEVVMHRFVLAEFNTHRMFSRNSASSRAIPGEKQRDRVSRHPAIPAVWATEQKGMQGGEPLDEAGALVAETIWLDAARHAAECAKDLEAVGVHKSITNRLIEPFMWHTVIVSATEWDGFWAQRCSLLAQPEMRVAAEAMKDAYDASEPEKLDYGMWHLPYLDGQTIIEVASHGPHEWAERTLCQISAARCARVSYLTQDGTRDWTQDQAMFDRLVSAYPPHASPLEHVATPYGPFDPASEFPGNFRGWRQLRHEVLPGW